MTYQPSHFRSKRAVVLRARKVVYIGVEVGGQLQIKSLLAVWNQLTRFEEGRGHLVTGNTVRSLAFGLSTVNTLPLLHQHLSFEANPNLLKQTLRSKQSWETGMYHMAIAQEQTSPIFTDQYNIFPWSSYTGHSEKDSVLLKKKVNIYVFEHITTYFQDNTSAISMTKIEWTLNLASRGHLDQSVWHNIRCQVSV